MLAGILGSDWELSHGGVQGSEWKGAPEFVQPVKKLLRWALLELDQATARTMYEFGGLKNLFRASSES